MKMKTQHTPGPWHLSKGKNYVRKLSPTLTDAPQDYNICELNCMVGNPEFEANARLIAAAPDMLEALEEIAANWGNPARALKRLASVKAAIAKARGE